MVLYSKRLINGLLFYIGWFVCILAAIKCRIEWAFLVTIAILLIHFLFYNQRVKDLILLIALSSAGLLMDTTFLQAGWLSYHCPNRFFPELAPYWVVCLHAIFSTTINHSFAWLKHYPVSSAFLGGAGIAWSYLAGQKMGAVEFLIPNITVLIAIGCVWFFYLPAVFWFSLWLDKKLGA